MNELIQTLKEQIIDALNLEEITPEDIDNNEPLFGAGLGLDSIDALELIVILDRHYGIKLANPAEGKEIFKSVSSIADYVAKNRTK
ncbi:MAG: acyl carrier protein [Bacteroidales bacterium]|jgi:acyl carrier protein|nr:acyl carrier protein [Bacteroidales bacterium]